VQNASSLIWLALVAVAIPATYLIVRRTQLHALIALLVGSVLDSVIFLFYSLSVNDSPTQAVAAGLIAGILFNTLTVVAAAYFRQNDPIARN
jgi:hypothetical protein